MDARHVLLGVRATDHNRDEASDSLIGEEEAGRRRPINQVEFKGERRRERERESERREETGSDRFASLGSRQESRRTDERNAHACQDD